MYTVQISVQPHISENTEKPPVILHLFVCSHCHTCILNTIGKNLTKVNSINPEKFRFWLTIIKSSFTTEHLKISHLHMLRVCTRRQERAAGSSGWVWHSWMDTTQMYPQEGWICSLAQKWSVNLGAKLPPVKRLTRKGEESQELICVAAR